MTFLLLRPGELWREVALALRSLSRAPLFTGAVVLTLAIGVGATTAIYSVVDAVLLQPLPVPDGDQLVRIVEHERPRGMAGSTYAEYQEWRSRTTTLSDLAAATMNPQAMVVTPHGTVRLTAGMVSPNYFEVLQAAPLLGRTLVSADASAPDVAVLGIHMWRRHFESDPQISGQTFRLRQATGTERVLTIVGVLPEAMETIGAPLDFYMLLVPEPGMRSPVIGPLIGRLRPDATLAAASAEAAAIGEAVRAPRPASAPPLTRPRFEAISYKDDIVEAVRPALRVFLVAVFVVLMIVCTNAANLLLARGLDREREIAVRLALGATRMRVGGLVLIECVLVALAGGILGAALAASGVVLFRQMATLDVEGVFRIVFSSNSLPRTQEVVISARLLGTALGLALLSSAVFGLLPAWHLSRKGGLQALGARGASTTRRQAKLRSVLVAAQLAMATVLLVGAGLLAHSFVKLATVAKGYDPSNVLTFQLEVPSHYSTARKVETIEGLLARLRARPDVTAAGFAYAGILLGLENTVGSFVPPGRSLDEIAAEPDRPRLKALSAGYLPAMGVPLLAGQGLQGDDAATAEAAVLINRTVANRYFAGANPVGATLIWHGGKGAPKAVRVVGVVEDVRQMSMERPPYPEVFMDYRQVLALQQAWGATTQTQEALALGFLSFGVRTARDPVAMIPAVRDAITETSAELGIDAIAPMERLVSHSMARQRLYAVIPGLFALVAAALAALGLYGVVAYAVVQRTREVGIRMALGATRRRVLSLVLRGALAASAIGIVVGLVAAFAGARYLEHLLFGVEPLDPATFAGVAVAFLVVAAVASYVPGRRAASVDPAVALRHE